MTITSLDQPDLNQTYTYADYLTWRFAEMVELFRGKIMRMSPAPLRYHQDIAGQIFSDIRQFLRSKSGCKVYIAPFDVRLPKKDPTDAKIYTVVQPDVCIICNPAKLDVRGCVGAPDTMIEVVSKGNFSRDIRDKFSLYEEHGVPEYWLVFPQEKMVVIYLLTETGQYGPGLEYGEPGAIPVHSLPGFALDWADIFEE